MLRIVRLNPKKTSCGPEKNKNNELKDTKFCSVDKNCRAAFKLQEVTLSNLQLLRMLFAMYCNSTEKHVKNMNNSKVWTKTSKITWNSSCNACYVLFQRRLYSLKSTWHHQKENYFQECFGPPKSIVYSSKTQSSTIRLQLSAEKSDYYANHSSKCSFSQALIRHQLTFVGAQQPGKTYFHFISMSHPVQYSRSTTDSSNTWLLNITCDVSPSEWYQQNVMCAEGTIWSG